MDKKGNEKIAMNDDKKVARTAMRSSTMAKMQE